MTIHEVPFLSMGSAIEDDDVQAAVNVMQAAMQEEGGFFPLPEETNFQDAFAAHEGSRKAVVVNSAGTALDVCMQVLGICPGDEAITSPLTFVCTAGCAAARGAKIVFADVKSDTLNLDPEKVEAKITPETKVIIPVHLSGFPAEIDAFNRISENYSIPVIYDAAHAVGAHYKDSPVGNAGKASCYSFQSNKNMTTLGEGGMITSDDLDFAEKARRKKTFGYIYGGTSVRVATIGSNYRMTKIQAAVGLTQLSKVDRLIAERLNRFQRMQNLLQDVPEIICPSGIREGHACHLYIIRVDTEKVRFSREDFRNHLKEKYQVGTVVNYPVVWSWEAFQDVEYDRSDCLVAERAAQQVISMPVFPKTRYEDLDYIVWAVKETITDLKKN